MRLYLASTSPARLATLRAAGIEPIVVPSEVDEDAAVAAHGPIDAAGMVQLLARAKAEAIVGRLVGGAPIDGFILGGDSAFELDGVTYGKPHTPSVARERWLLQRGRTGHLHSGHWLIDHRLGSAAGSGQGVTVADPVRGAGQVGTAASPLRGAGQVSTAAVTFAPDISDAEIDAYIATGEPLAVAGAFTIDSLGAPFITAVDGDPHAVVGLSLSTLRTLLLGFGVSWPDLWNRPPASS